MRKDSVSFADFNKVDIRVGEVKEAQNVAGSKSLIQLTVDLGEDYGLTTILTGLAKYYPPEEFIGKKFAFIANLEPKPMMGIASNGMLLVVDTDDKPLLITLDNKVKNGEIVR